MIGDLSKPQTANSLSYIIVSSHFKFNNLYFSNRKYWNC